MKSTDEKVADISLIDIRVGKVIEVWPNPKSDRLFNMKIDLGNGDIRSVGSTL